MTVTNAFADLEEDLVHRATRARGVLFTGFGPDGNGERVRAWLTYWNVDSHRDGDDIVFDNGTDDMPIRAARGDEFIRDPDDDNIHRVKAHRVSVLYRRRRAVAVRLLDLIGRPA